MRVLMVKAQRRPLKRKIKVLSIRLTPPFSSAMVKIVSRQVVCVSDVAVSFTLIINNKYIISVSRGFVECINGSGSYFRCEAAFILTL